MSTFEDRVTAGVKEKLSGLIDSHCEVHAVYRDARYRVALGEMQGVFTPDQVDSLELKLANLYEALHDQAAELARISTELEFGNDG